MTDDLISTGDVAALLGLDRRSVGDRARRGTMKPPPALKLPGPRGAYLFKLSEVEKVANEKAEK